MTPPTNAAMECAKELFDQNQRIMDASLYCGQVQQEGAAVEHEFCQQVSAIIDKHFNQRNQK